MTKQVNEAKNSSGVATESPRPALLPCPFCGGESSTAFSDGTEHFIECGYCACGAQSGAFFSREAAIEAWNTRANVTARDAEATTVD